MSESDATAKPSGYLTSGSYSCILVVDLCLQRFCGLHTNKNLCGPLRKIIYSYYVYESLTDETIFNAVARWCKESLVTKEEVAMRYGHISHWDVHKVTNMVELFYMCSSFNENIELWDVSNVRDMGRMFCLAKSFNQPLNGWDVRNVENMNCMFYCAHSFNQPLDAWQVESVIGMNSMFRRGESFNQSLSNWDVAKDKDMSNMFSQVRSTIKYMAGR